MHLSPDEIVFFEYEFIKLNSTIVYTWLLMLLMVGVSWGVTRNLSGTMSRSRWQNFIEIILLGICGQIGELGLAHPSRYLSFVGSLFLFLATATAATVLPIYEPPSGSLSTTVALALCVFVAVPAYGISGQGLRGYLRTYIEPTPVMLPFHLIGEVFRTLALAVRLFGNMMSGTMIVAILLSIMPYVFPVLMTALGLLTGLVQSYIFSTLAAVYIAAAVQGHGSRERAE